MPISKKARGLIKRLIKLVTYRYIIVFIKISALMHVLLLKVHECLNKVNNRKGRCENLIRIIR